MKYVIGIDGGGTKTSLKVVGVKGDILAQCIGGPSNINSSTIESVQTVFKNLICEGILKSKSSLDDCLGICVGTAGADREKDKIEIEKMIRNIGFLGKTIIVNDAEIALYGGVEKNEGIIVISGTGSICYGRTKEGKKCRSGGWGHIIGDEGSGYDIGIKALKAVLRSYDGRDEKTMLEEMVLDYLELKCPEDLIGFVYRSGAGKKEIAALTRVINEAFNKGDKVSEKILKESSYELFLGVKAVVNKLGLSDKHVLLTTTGGSINNIKYLYDQFAFVLHSTYPKIEIIPMRNDPAWGACLIAIEKIDA